VNNAQPGDIIKVQGIILPRQLAKNFMQKELYFDSYIYVTKIIREKKKYVDINVSEEMRKRIEDVHKNMEPEELINNLAKSIAPEIYGMENVKKALLMQMAGGVTT
jgi:DNA replication licensing factor MCM7